MRCLYEKGNVRYIIDKNSIQFAMKNTYRESILIHRNVCGVKKADFEIIQMSSGHEREKRRKPRKIYYIKSRSLTMLWLTKTAMT